MSLPYFRTVSRWKLKHLLFLFRKYHKRNELYTWGMRPSFHSTVSFETPYKIVLILHRKKKKKINYFSTLARMSSLKSSVHKACTSSLTLWKLYGTWRKWVILLLKSVYHFGHFLTGHIFTSAEFSDGTLRRKNILSSLTKPPCSLPHILSSVIL